MRLSRCVLSGKNVPYIQGRYVDGGNSREYFYYISHEGRLFLDDTKHKNFTSSYKDVPFLNFFYRMLRINKTGEWNEFPFMSRCGIERNYLRCDDRPFVYTRLRFDGNEDRLRIGESGLEESFKADSLLVGSNGRLYHPSRIGNGLITSRLADELFPFCTFNEKGRAISIDWKGQKYPIGYI